MSTSSKQTVLNVPKKYIPSWLKQERTRVLTETSKSDPFLKDGKSVIYWMQRDMRTVDNWALLFAMNLAKELKVPLRVVSILPSPKEQVERITARHASFLLGGLKLVEKELNEINVPLDIICHPCTDSSSSGEALFHYATNEQNCAKVVICDFNPLRLYRRWMENEAAPLFSSKSIPLYQVDAHNIVPVWQASDKREVGARTLRPKVNRLMPDFMTYYPTLEDIDFNIQPKGQCKDTIDWNACYDFLNPDTSVKPVKWAQPGTKAAMKQFEFFKTNGLKNFDKLRNDPNHQNICSNLSPWVNYGHVSFQRLALEVREDKKFPNGTAAYIEEGVVRRELSDNFVFYAPDNYDSLSGAAQWAQDSLELHTTDEREFLYSKEDFESGKTHDDLWNAAQIQLIKEGKMHGFLRMYWAKKILEWSPSPASALSTAQYLNDKYSLDGNDPNGFVGIGWSIMGIHDMGWKERPIFGKIRFMNYAGCKRKFKVADFVAKYPPAAENASKLIPLDQRKKVPSRGTKRKKR